MIYTKKDFLNLPKADVHNHFHLGGSQKKLLEKYPKSNIIFQKKYDGLNGMIDFIYKHLNEIMLTKKDVINFMETSIESSILDNIVLLEASVDVNLARFFNDSIEDLINEVINLKEKYKNQINFKPEIGINKDLSLDKIHKYANYCMDSQVFSSIDIYGKEANQNLEKFKTIFDKAREYGLKTKVHIGEFSSSKSIYDTILLLNPDEIQHGNMVADSNKTMDLLLEKDIRLNLCPSSNISLGAVKNIENHPIRKLFDYGVNITVNTDDYILFNSSVTDELYNLYKNNIFSFEELNKIRNNAFV